MAQPKRVSLSNELHVLMDSLRGVHSLTRQWIDSFGNEPQLPDQVYAVLTLLIERIRLLDRVVRGTIDPHLVWSPQNDVDPIPGDPKEEDMILSAWSVRKQARHHRKAWRTLKRRLRIIKARDSERLDLERE
jgi:hypothetical protein